MGGVVKSARSVRRSITLRLPSESPTASREPRAVRAERVGEQHVAVAFAEAVGSRPTGGEGATQPAVARQIPHDYLTTDRAGVKRPPVAADRQPADLAAVQIDEAHRAVEGAQQQCSTVCTDDGRTATRIHATDWLHRPRLAYQRGSRRARRDEATPTGD